MNKEETIKIAAIIATGIIVYLLLNKHPAIASQTEQPTDGFINNPNYQSYLPSTAFQPTSPDITVNVDNQGLNYLNDNYIPLFGFVGIAQGQTLQ